MNKRVLISGITGFLGSNIARAIIAKGFQVIGLHRTTSSFDRITDIYGSLKLINIQKDGWLDDIKKEKIDLLIHVAWEGVNVAERDNWNIQLKNFEFSKLVYNTAIYCGVSRIVSFGSQAEYGIFNKKVSESYVPLPIDAYGAVKLLTLYYLHSFAEKSKIEWYWLRVFSVFGTGENPDWLIPSVIRKIKKHETIELTEGMQVYDYMHSDDFVRNFMKIVMSTSDNSGVYNLCSGTGIETKNLLNKIASNFPDAKTLLEFGKIPYRENQKMFIVGNPGKFESVYGKINQVDFSQSIKKTINLYY